MTLSELSTLLPPPEGMEWHEDTDFPHAFILTFVDGAVYLRQPTGLAAGQWQLCAEKGDDCIVIYITVPDLPTAYLRALTAVGLATDAEKEDLRRRLTWTSEVPTESGLYVASEPDWDIALYEFDASDNSWRPVRGGDWIEGKLFDPGTRFMPCPQPPKETT